ncbi:MAG: hypothetical protein IJZ84_05615 [Lachnospiraceae bacterium]|nr:hypothetical protein [Lachnospiraceae bacterium]
MIKVIGVRFRTAGKIYFFDPVDFEINKGDHVIVETARGIEFGTVVGGIRQVTDDEVVQPLKPVLRIASERDEKQEADNKRREKEAYKLCLEKIREHELEMKLIDAEYTFDNNKVLFYFTADGRIDFRELVKDLAAIFKTRIELRQIGVRDETKIMGGIGMCGRPLCCHAHLSDFMPVSIKMAKEQNLSLNPTKISGVCGRLMCCLNHEEETYEELNRSLPHVGDRVTCPDGIQGEVTSANVLRQQVKVVVENGDSKEIREYKAEDLRFVRKGHRQVKEEVSAEELRALELLEKQDKLDTQETEEKPEKPSRKERGERRERKNREERENAGDRRGREERENGGERRGREERENGGERRSREERENSGEQRSREERENGGEQRNREERKPRGDRKEHSRKEKERTDRAAVQQETVSADREKVRIEDAAAEKTRDTNNADLQERKGHSNKKRRPDKYKNYNKEGHQTDKEQKPVTEEQLQAENVSANVNVDTAGSEHQQEGQRTERNYRKKNYYRNRRRNRPEGAKEQHES